MQKIMKFVTAIAAAATLSGCNLFDSDNDNDTTEIETPAVSTLLDVARDNGNFTTLLAALEATNLDEAINDEEATLTVFAPTDAAFELLGQEAIDDLLENPDALSNILNYHVIGSEIDSTAAIAAAGTTVETLNGSNVGISLSGEDLLINLSTVVTPDVQADNGVIHVIDAVLMPPMPTDASEQTISEVVAADERFETLLLALQTTDNLVDTLDDADSQFTVFAPTDEAFAMIDDGLLNAILQDEDTLNAILLQHVISSGVVDSVTAFSLNGTSVVTASEASIPIAINTDTDTLTVGGASVIITDIQTANGIIHVIDTVIIGDVTLPTPIASSIVDIAVEAGTFTTLIDLLQQTGLDVALADLDETYTVFAPSDAAFDQVDDATLTALANDVNALRNVLEYHVITGASVLADAALATAQSDMSLVDMTNGQQAALSVSGSTLYINKSTVSATNILADNGVIHVVDQVIIPSTSLAESEQTIVDIAVSDPDLSSLVDALTDADLVSTLDNEDATFTVFAPTNSAFAKIPTDTLNTILADNDILRPLLLQHVISGVSIDEVGAFAANGTSVDTESGEDIAIEIVNYTQSTDDANAEVAYDAVTNRLIGGMNSLSPGFSLYVFDDDLGSAGSECNDSCADLWPPVIVEDGAVSSIPGLSVITRENGDQQAAYLGRPLYFFANDTESDDTNGDEQGGVWFVERVPQTILTVQGSTVTTTNISASNGVIHIIDTVITETLE